MKFICEDDGLNLLMIEDDGLRRFMYSRPRQEFIDMYWSLKPFAEPQPAVVESESLSDA